jgi:2-C-methyl-D-erythritol 4-phosphate cytidylyltransferase
MWVSTIIVAAGKGIRFGGKKQFYPLCGKPVVVWSVEAFNKLSREIILILPEGDLNRFKKKWLVGYPKVKVFRGGVHRYDSVMRGLKNLSPNCDYVCIHDGVRPLIDTRTIKRCISTAEKYGSAVCATQSTDTVKISGAGQFIETTIDRKKVWMIQTPQVFKVDTILSAYGNPEVIAGATDDATLVEKLGIKPKLVPGKYTNIKITESEDILFAEQVLRKRKNK